LVHLEEILREKRKLAQDSEGKRRKQPKLAGLGGGFGGLLFVGFDNFDQF